MPDVSFEELILNSDEYKVLMNHCLQIKFFQQVRHFGHLYIELLLKAALLKYGKNYDPDGDFAHNLDNLSSTWIEEKKSIILIMIQENSLIHEKFRRIKSAWKMKHRYIRMNISETESKTNFDDYKEVGQWIYNRFLQK